MTSAAAHTPNLIEWGAASAAYLGESVSGDLPLIANFPEGALVAVIDGLGHGPEAARAAHTAGRILLDHASDNPLRLVEQCHEGLRKTRGVAMSLASWDAQSGTLTWLGVGNVEGILLHPDVREPRGTLNPRGGVVGYRLPSLRSETLSVTQGDTLVFATDGLKTTFKAHIDLRLGAQAMADDLLGRTAKGTDDACVAVARYVALPRVCVPIRHAADASMARAHVRAFASRRGFPGPVVEGLATAVSELASNIVRHAVAGGEVQIAFIEEGDRSGVSILARDDGPGIADIARAMQDGYSSAGSLGLGLSSARRFADDFELHSAEGQGTLVILKKWLR